MNYVDGGVAVSRSSVNPPVSPLRAWRRATTVGVALFGVALLAMGCVGEQGAAPALHPAGGALGNVTVTPWNAIMAVGDTMQIGVSIRSLTGVAITQVDSIEYQLPNVPDTGRVHVSATGLVTALASSSPGAPVKINVLVFKDGVVRGDQALIQVTATAIDGLSLSIQPDPSDSAKIAVNSYKAIVPVIANVTSGLSVPGPTLRFEFHDADLAKVGCYVPGIVAPPDVVSFQIADCAGAGLNELDTRSQTGSVWVYANVLAYGTLLRDSVQYTITNSYTGYVSVGDFGTLSVITRAQSDVQIAPGGIVYFASQMTLDLNATINYTFDSPAAATAPPDDDEGSGNIIGLLGDGTLVPRQFVTPGTYTWTATVIGSVPPYTGQTVSGKIVVQ